MVQVAQSLTKAVGGCLRQPVAVWIALGFGQLAALLEVVDPGTSTSVLAALLQADIPDRAAGCRNPLGVCLLFGCEQQQVAATD